MDVFITIYIFEGKLFLSFLGSLSLLLVNKLASREERLCTSFLTDATHHRHKSIEPQIRQLSMDRTLSSSW